MTPFEQGKAAFSPEAVNQRGEVWTRPFGLNPFDIGSPEYAEWDRGFNEAFAEAGKC